MIFFYLQFLSISNDTGLLREMGENVSFKFAYLADSNSADLSKMELTNATILGDKGFSPLFLMNTRRTQIFSYRPYLEICQKTQGH